MKRLGWKALPEGGIIEKAGNSVEFKTGCWKTSFPKWSPEKCLQCLKCHFLCPEGAIKVRKGKIVGIDLDYCKGCGICANECPVKAIVMEAKNGGN